MEDPPNAVPNDLSGLRSRAMPFYIFTSHDNLERS